MSSPADSSEHPFDRLGVVTRAVLIVLVSIATGLVLAVLTNGFPAAEAAKRMAARAYMPILTETYPAQGRDQITVLTIDDLDLEHLGMSWPVPMDYYQRLIDRLVVLRPKALFIDILFLDDRPKGLVDRFAQAACAAREAGTPVYVASLGGQRRPSRTMEWLAAASSGGSPCIQFVAPNILDDRYDRSTWEYPLQVIDQDGAPGLRSAALALACDLVPGACPAATDTAMSILWPTRGDQINTELHLQADREGVLRPTCVNEVPLLDMVPLVSHIVRNFLGQGQRPVLCPYNRQIPIRALSGVGLEADERIAVIREKIVLLGTAFQSSGDRIASPLDQELPAVHAHAIALDNLISLNGEYRRSGDFDLRNPGSPASLFTMFALALIAIGSMVWHCFTTARDRMGAPEKIPNATSANGMLDKWFKRGKYEEAWWPVRSIAFGLRLILLPVLRVVSLAQWPGETNTQTSLLKERLVRIGAAVVLFIIGMCLVFLLGDWLQVGPLSVIEYFLFPLGVDFLDRRDALPRRVALFVHVCGQADPVKELRRWLHGDPEAS